MKNTTKALTAKQLQAIDTLVHNVSDGGYLRENSTISVLTVNVARSGMSRTVRVFVPVRTLSSMYIADITHLVADALGYKIVQKELGASGVITLSGAGMDLHDHLVQQLAKVTGLTLNKITL